MDCDSVLLYKNYLFCRILAILSKENITLKYHKKKVLGSFLENFNLKRKKSWKIKFTNSLEICWRWFQHLQIRNLLLNLLLIFVKHIQRHCSLLINKNNQTHSHSIIRNNKETGYNFFFPPNNVAFFHLSSCLLLIAE